MQDVFTEIKSKLNVKDVIEYYLSTHFNKNKCVCPFHNDKNASLSVKPSTNTFRCFGCGAGGSVIDFVMKLKDIDKFEASKTLSKDFGLDLEFCKTKIPNESIKQYLLR